MIEAMVLNLGVLSNGRMIKWAYYQMGVSSNGRNPLNLFELCITCWLLLYRSVDISPSEPILPDILLQKVQVAGQLDFSTVGMFMNR